MKRFLTCPMCNAGIAPIEYACPTCTTRRYNKKRSNVLVVVLIVGFAFGIACLVGLAVGVVRVGL